MMRSIPLWQSDVECAPPAVDSPHGTTMAQVQNASLDFYVPCTPPASGEWTEIPIGSVARLLRARLFVDGIIEPQFNIAQAKVNADEVKITARAATWRLLSADRHQSR